MAIAKESDAVVGLVMDFFRPGILEGCRAYAGENGIRLDARWSVRGDWLSYRPPWDGVVCGVVDDEGLERRLQGWGVGLVHVSAADGEYTVLHDYRSAAELGIGELVAAGVGKVVMLRMGDKLVDAECDRVDLEKVLPKGVAGSKLDVRPLGWPEGMRDALMEEIEGFGGKVGLFLPHAGIAHVVEEQLLDAGLQIPDDVCLVVIDKDVQQTASLAPVPLSSVELNDWHCGFLAMETLHAVMEGRIDEPVHLKLAPAGMRRRRSSGHLEREDAVMAKALIFLRDQFRQAIGVDDVVAHAGVSRRLLETRFREILKRGVREELIRLRMEAAKGELAAGLLSVTEVAERCGFSSVHYFSTAFKREVGVTPKGYQRGERS